MPTELFIRRPLLWMTFASRKGVTVTSSPNFGYRHYLKVLGDRDVGDLDLSRVRLIYNGAEPISVELADEFMDAPARPRSCARTAMYPVYGLAEATLVVSFPQPPGEMYEYVAVDRHELNVGKPPAPLPTEHADALSHHGRGPADSLLQRAHRRRRRTRSCPRITSATSSSPATTSRRVISRTRKPTPRASPPRIQESWLRTGDLGMLKGGKLYITGRAKEIIFVNGQNYYPHDIESIAIAPKASSSARWSRPACAPKARSTDELIIFVLHRMDMKEFMPIAAQVTRLVNEHTGLEVAHVVPVKRIPKTTSGKIQRHLLEEDYVNGVYEAELAELAALRAQLEAAGGAKATSNEIERKIKDICDAALERNIDVHDNLFEIGASSLKLIEIHEQIDRIYPGLVDLTELFDFPTIAELSTPPRRQDGRDRLKDRRGQPPFFGRCLSTLGDGGALCDRRRCVPSRSLASAPRFDHNTTATQQRQGQEDGEGGTVEYEHDAGSDWQCGETYPTDAVRKTGQRRIHCPALLYNPAPWTSCRECGCSPGWPSSALSRAPRDASTCRGPWPRAMWRSSKNTSAPACSTAPRARCRFRRRARSTSSTASASSPRSTPPTTSCGWRATARRASCASTCPCAFGKYLLLPAIPQFTQRYPDISLEVRFNDRFVDLRPRAWTWRCAWARCARPISSPSVSPHRACSPARRRNTWRAPACRARPKICASTGSSATCAATPRGPATGSSDRAGARARAPADGAVVQHRPRPLPISALEGQGIVQQLDLLVGGYLAEGRLVEVLREYSCEGPPIQRGLSARHPAPGEGARVRRVRGRSDAQLRSEARRATAGDARVERHAHALARAAGCRTRRTRIRRCARACARGSPARSRRRAA